MSESSVAFLSRLDSSYLKKIDETEKNCGSCEGQVFRYRGKDKHIEKSSRRSGGGRGEFVSPANFENTHQNLLKAIVILLPGIQETLANGIGPGARLARTSASERARCNMQQGQHRQQAGCGIHRYTSDISHGNRERTGQVHGRNSRKGFTRDVGQPKSVGSPRQDAGQRQVEQRPPPASRRRQHTQPTTRTKGILVPENIKRQIFFF